MSFKNLNNDIVRDFTKVMNPYMSNGEANAWLNVLDILVDVIADKAKPVAEAEKPISKKGK